MIKEDRSILCKELKLKLVFFTFVLFVHYSKITAQPASLSPDIISYISNTSLSVRDVHSDCAGNSVYVGGTSIKGYNVTSGTINSGYLGGNSDAFVFKIDSVGKVLWSTVIGGNLYDRAYAVEIDSAGFIYVAGRVGTGMKTSDCALQKTFAGDISPNSAYGIQDGFITKLTPDGSTVVWCTYIGCDGPGFVRDIDLDSKGNVWVGMSDVSSKFPYITANAVQKTATFKQNSALVKLSADGKTILYGTFMADGVMYGGRTTVRVDKKDNVYFLSHASGNNMPITLNAFQKMVKGNDDFVISKFDANGNLLFCSFLGGSGQEEVETHSLEIDSYGNVIVAAYTFSSDYPVVGNAIQDTFLGVRDGVITKISADGTKILASTYLGGNQLDEIEGVGIDANDNIYVSGTTGSADFPVTKSIAYQPNLGGGRDGHITVVSPDLSKVLYSTFVGGSGNDQFRSCHVDPNGKVYGGGNTGSTNYPKYKAFHPSLTGTLTGTALVLRPANLFQNNKNCFISNTFKDPCLPVGITDISSSSEIFSIQPNPSKEFLTITLNQNQNSKGELKIYNALGDLVKQIEIIHSTTITVSELPPGPYFICLNNTGLVKKFIKV